MVCIRQNQVEEGPQQNPKGGTLYDSRYSVSHDMPNARHALCLCVRARVCVCVCVCVCVRACVCVCALTWLPLQYWVVYADPAPP